MLCLLLLQPNRTARAWWIWLPLLAVFAVELGLRAVLAELPSQAVDMLSQVTHALAFGLAGLWLAAPFLAGTSRFRTFFKLLPVHAGFTLLAYVGGQDWGDGGEAVAALIYLGVFVLVFVSALILAGRGCRHHFTPVRFSLCLFGWLTVGFVAVLLPFAIPAFITAGNQVWSHLGLALLVTVSVQFLVALPFLLLSFTNNLYRERLQQLLLPAEPAKPPVLAPAPPPAPVTCFDERIP